ncbi:hypothetical protein BKC07_10755 [Peribacillus simplex]|nr:hypothetical protein BKC07_10755 [Peribacillus simplex]
MGLIIVTSTNKDVWDKNGYHESLGKPRITQVREGDIARRCREKIANQASRSEHEYGSKKGRITGGNLRGTYPSM